jgi:hypothetical protein
MLRTVKSERGHYKKRPELRTPHPFYGRMGMHEKRVRGFSAVRCIGIRNWSEQMRFNEQPRGLSRGIRRIKNGHLLKIPLSFQEEEHPLSSSKQAAFASFMAVHFLTSLRR